MVKQGRGNGDNGERLEERRRQILDAAAAVFARRGYHQARTREIAAEAGIAEGTIYNYFSTKRDLLLALIQRITVESVPETLTQPGNLDPRSWLAAAIRDRLAMLDRNGELIRAVMPEMMTDTPLHQQYLRQVIVPSIWKYLPLTEQVFRGAPVRSFNPRVILPALIGATATAYLFSQWTELPVGTHPSLEDLATELAEFFLHGLLADGAQGAVEGASA